MTVHRLVLIFLCLVFLLCACTPAPSSAETGPIASGAAATEPMKSVTSEPFAIALESTYTDEDHSSEQRKAQQAVLGRVENHLNNLGWKIRIMIRDVNRTDLTVDAYMDAIKQDIASGSSADGYQVAPEEAQQLGKLGLTQDAGALCQQSAPQLYDRFQALQQNACGIPMRFRYWTKYQPAVLFIKNSVRAAYDKPIANADDLWAFLEAGQNAVMASDSYIGPYDIWAAQQGYYRLCEYGLPVLFYARMDDAACTPVPLEQISGFEEAFRRIGTLEQQGKLTSLWLQTDSIPANVCGYLSPLTRQVNLEILQLMGNNGADYTAIPLQGCTAPAMDDDDPDIRMMLAVPVVSKHGNAVAAFAQWALASPDGYVSINYGKQDVDYRRTEEGIEYLKAGAPLTAEDWKEYSTFTLPAMCTFRGTLFYSDELEPSTVYQARNADALMKNPRVLPPIWKIKELRKVSGLEDSPFGDVMSEYQDAMRIRMEVLYALDMQDQTDRHLDQQLEALATVKDQMSDLSKKLKDRLNTMLSR